MYIQNIGKAQLQRGYYNNDGRAVVIPIRPREPYKEVSGATNMAVNHDYWFFAVYPLLDSKNKPKRRLANSSNEVKGSLQFG